MGRSSAVWIDVEDLFHYAGHNTRLSGIQRLTYELYTALQAQSDTGHAIGFVRIDPQTDQFVLVAWHEVQALCHGLTIEHDTTLPAAAPQRARVTSGSLTRWVAAGLQQRLTGRAHEQFQRFCILQAAAARSLAELSREGARGIRADPGASSRAVEPSRPVPGAAPGAALGPAAIGRSLLEVARPGDWLLSLGASWHRTDYGRLLERARCQGRLMTGLLFYDLIPLRRPEWCHRTLVQTFGRWLEGVLPSLDAMFAISQATADDVTRFLRARGQPMPGPVRPIPVGTGFPASAEAVRAEAAHVAPRTIPVPGSYVLFVSTIEARKNHALMFQIWRRLSQELPTEQLPTLVFAGRVGWLVADLMLQIANTNYVDGKLQIIEDPSDAVLIRLYEGCLFTVLPSLYEGWGLPVTESLAAGKPCVVSNLTSLPEAGAGLARMIDPFDFNDAYRVILETLRDREGLAAWECQVRQSFHPVPWSRSAASLLAGLEAEERDGPGAGLDTQALLSVTHV